MRRYARRELSLEDAEVGLSPEVANNDCPSEAEFRQRHWHPRRSVPAPRWLRKDESMNGRTFRLADPAFIKTGEGPEARVPFR
jgi:hypothetical protein